MSNHRPRPTSIAGVVRLLASLGAVVGLGFAPLHAEAVHIGSRWELMVDDYLVPKLDTGMQRLLHRPVEREVVLVLDAPWEGSACGVFTVFQDGELYRMYYRGWQFDIVGDKLEQPHRMVVCYAESRDGIEWRKPQLDLVAFKGSKRNNIVWDGVGSHNFTPFKDANPQCPETERYKAVGGIRREGGLFAFVSSDGIHWKLLQEQPIIRKGYFDSQNLAFWDPKRSEYRAYYRDFQNYPQGRDILTATSTDFVHWQEFPFLEYDPERYTELYTNQILPYYRAPHILLGFPMRYIERGESMTALNQRLSQVRDRYGKAQTDTGFMTSRDARRFKVWGEAFVRPGPQREDFSRWAYADSTQGWGIVATDSAVAGTPQELSFYILEDYWTGKSVRMRRATLRIDGFVSIHAPLSGGEFVTRPFTFDGNRLRMNFATSAAGSIRVEIQDEGAEPIPGFALADCPEIFGDSLERIVSWGQTEVGSLAGRPIRLRFVVKDADLFAFGFQ